MRTYNEHIQIDISKEFLNELIKLNIRILGEQITYPYSIQIPLDELIQSESGFNSLIGELHIILVRLKLIFLPNNKLSIELHFNDSSIEVFSRVDSYTINAIKQVYNLSGNIQVIFNIIRDSPSQNLILFTAVNDSISVFFDEESRNNLKNNNLGDYNEESGEIEGAYARHIKNQLDEFINLNTIELLSSQYITDNNEGQILCCDQSNIRYKPVFTSLNILPVLNSNEEKSGISIYGRVLRSINHQNSINSKNEINQQESDTAVSILISTFALHSYILEKVILQTLSNEIDNITFDIPAVYGNADESFDCYNSNTNLSNLNKNYKGITIKNIELQENGSYIIVKVRVKRCVTATIETNMYFSKSTALENHIKIEFGNPRIPRILRLLASDNQIEEIQTFFQNFNGNLSIVPDDYANQIQLKTTSLTSDYLCCEFISDLPEIVSPYQSVKINVDINYREVSSSTGSFNGTGLKCMPRGEYFYIQRNREVEVVLSANFPKNKKPWNPIYRINGNLLSENSGTILLPNIRCFNYEPYPSGAISYKTVNIQYEISHILKLTIPPDFGNFEINIEARIGGEYKREYISINPIQSSVNGSDEFWPNISKCLEDALNEFKEGLYVLPPIIDSVNPVASMHNWTIFKSFIVSTNKLNIHNGIINHLKFK